MDNLSRFYIELSTNADKLTAFNCADSKTKRLMLETAGVDDIEHILSQNEESLRKTLASNLISNTGQWHSIETNAGNTDNRDNKFKVNLQNH